MKVMGFRPDFIEHQLAHAVRDLKGRAYNRTAHLPERRKMMLQWADYGTKKALNQRGPVRDGAGVISRAGWPIQAMFFGLSGAVSEDALYTQTQTPKFTDPDKTVGKFPRRRHRGLMAPSI
jgi:hypothetical protein